MRKLGEALKAVVSEGYEADAEGAPESPLMHPNRRRAFEHVAWNPCCSASEVARALRVSGPTAAWHLRKLAEAGYLVETRVRRGRRYHVSGLGLEDAEREALAALGRAGAADAFAAILESPGLTRREVAAKLGRRDAGAAVAPLLRTGLLAAVADGRYRRLYPGPRVAALERSIPKRMRDFRRRLLRSLERDLLAPEARTAPGDVLEVDVRFGDERATLRLPMGSLLAARLG